ncbi:MAG: hypothetical protein UU47_C0016G0017 [candidate division TM6 bacterium GW2011_GWE2_41_16]|nr:MAG: hypothetical protein UU47_C0016G0017 [candidate division TM6 bacterium GW2011_GWE2_41_16]
MKKIIVLLSLTLISTMALMGVSTPPFVQMREHEKTLQNILNKDVTDVLTAIKKLEENPSVAIKMGKDTQPPLHHLGNIEDALSKAQDALGKFTSLAETQGTYFYTSTDKNGRVGGGFWSIQPVNKTTLRAYLEILVDAFKNMKEHVSHLVKAYELRSQFKELLENKALAEKLQTILTGEEIKKALEGLNFMVESIKIPRIGGNPGTWGPAVK